MATKVEIFNRAASEAGETRVIQSVDETGLVPSSLARNYDTILREVFEFRPWPWARVKAALSLSTEIRVGWDFVFVLPADCVTPLALLLEDERRELVPTRARLPFEVVLNDARDGYLLCTEDDQFEVLEYVAFIDNPAIYPAHFVDALSLRLAAYLLNAVKKAPQEAMAMMGRYELAAAVAYARANNAAGVPAVVESPALVAHGGGRSDGRWPWYRGA